MMRRAGSGWVTGGRVAFNGPVQVSAVNFRRFACRPLCEWKFKSRGAVHSCLVQSSTGAGVSPGGRTNLSV